MPLFTAVLHTAGTTMLLPMQATVVRYQGDKGGTRDKASANESKNASTEARPWLPFYPHQLCAGVSAGLRKGTGAEEQLFCASKEKDSVCVCPWGGQPILTCLGLTRAGIYHLVSCEDG